MKTVAKPKVFISYTWRPDNPSDPIDNPEARMLKLADRLRAAGLDCRIDQYFLLSLHGFVKPQRRPGDKVEPWVTWAGEQIKDADFVLLVCSAQYAANVCKSPLGGDLTWEQWHAMPDDLKFRLQEYQMDENTGKKDKLPYAWWDWHFMIQDMESGRAERRKFIPVGFAPYSWVSKYVPYFIKGESYYNLDSNKFGFVCYAKTSGQMAQSWYDYDTEKQAMDAAVAWMQRWLGCVWRESATGGGFQT